MRKFIINSKNELFEYVDNGNNNQLINICKLESKFKINDDSQRRNEFFKRMKKLGLKLNELVILNNRVIKL